MEKTTPMFFVIDNNLEIISSHEDYKEAEKESRELRNEGNNTRVMSERAIENAGIWR